jgi:putative membrane protein
MFEHPSVIVGVIVLALLYTFAAWRVGGPLRTRQILAFCWALIVILIAHGPIDELADERLFFVHMFQHFLQTLVIPPLLLLGTPDWMLRPWVMRRLVRPFARLFTRPVITFALFGGLLVIVHEPLVFDRMCRDETFHIAIHLLFMVTGTLLWWPLLSPMPELPRLSYPAQVIYLFLLLIPMSAIAAPVTLSTTVIYPWYAQAPHPWGLSPLSDQVLGGLVMWVGESLYLMCVFSAIFFRWAGRDDRDRPLVRGSLLSVVPRHPNPAL